MMKISIEYQTPEFYYSLACFAYILTGLLCAVIRWNHLCRPYDQQADRFYPARRQVTFFYAAIVMTLPYVFAPMNGDVWFFVRSFGIVYYPICFAMIFHRYFRMGRMNRNWYSRLYFYIPMVLLVALLCLALLGEEDILGGQAKLIWECVMGGVSLLVSGRFVREGVWLRHKIDEFHTQNYSNESDFPYRFAKKVLFQPLIWLVIMWGVFLSDNRWVNFVVEILVTLWMVKFLCMILHPHRMLHSESDSAEEKISEDAILENEVFDEVDSDKSNPSEEEWNRAKCEVLEIVDRRYLEPSLKRVEVVRDVKGTTQALAGKFITEVGFYNLVNAFRIRHYERLMETEAGNLSQEMIAERCGFKNRWALSNARKRLKDFDFGQIEYATSEMISR